MRARGWILTIVLAFAAAAMMFHAVRRHAPAPPPRTAAAPPAAAPISHTPAPPPPHVASALAPGIRFVHGRRDVKTVALTFDDGPFPRNTRHILAILAKYKVRATFFIIGKMAAESPQLVAEVHAQGHLIGNHSYRHKPMRDLSRSAARQEWAKCNQLLTRLTGEKIQFCRPPKGWYRAATLAAAADEGMSVVFWSVESRDYRHPTAATIAARTLRNVRSGDIILLHETAKETVEALPQIIETLQARGFQFRTIDEMAAETAPPPPATSAVKLQLPSRGNALVRRQRTG